MSQPILSIIIPTKNRSYYLLETVKSLLMIENQNMEILIHDNSDNSNLKNELLKFEDNRIQYYYTNEPLSVVENFDRAIKCSKGIYVTTIGDDDGCSKYLIDAVEWINKNKYDSLLTPKGIFYWPGIKFRHFGDKFSGQFFLDNYSFRRTEINPHKEIAKCFQDGGCELNRMPRVYHGVVKREVLDKLYKVANTYFPGPSPDMANAVALCWFVEKALFMDIPLFITGNSPKSGGGMGTNGQHVGDLKNKSWLPKNVQESWSKKVPEFWSGQTVWAESAIKAVCNIGHGEFVRNLNIPMLHARSYVFNPSFRDESLKNYNKLIISEGKSPLVWNLKLVINILLVQFYRIRPMFDRIQYLLGFNIGFFQKRFLNVNTISTASDLLDKELTKRSVNKILN